MTVDIGTKDHIAIVVDLQTGDLTQQGDGVFASGEVFSLPRGSDGVLFDPMALGGIKRHACPKPISARSLKLWPACGFHLGDANLGNYGF